ARATARRVPSWRSARRARSRGAESSSRRRLVHAMARRRRTRRARRSVRPAARARLRPPRAAAPSSAARLPAEAERREEEGEVVGSLIERMGVALDGDAPRVAAVEREGPLELALCP